jgi:hypothetical protein
MEGIKKSNTSKMACESWSLQAEETCPGSIDPRTKKLVPSCEGCYATEGMYNMPNVKAVRKHNKQDWKRDTWVDEMVQGLDNSRYFRWFDSGMFILSHLQTRYIKSCNAHLGVIIGYLLNLISSQSLPLFSRR